MSGNIIIQKENGFSANICTTKSSTPPSTSLRITFKPSAELFGKFGFDWVRDTSNLGEYYIKYDTDPKKCIKCSVKDVGYIEDTCAWKEIAIFIPNNEMVVKYLKHFKILPELKNGNIDYYLSVMTLMPPQYGVNNVAVLDIIGGNPTSFEVDCDVLNAIEYFHDKYNNKLHIRSIGVLKKDVIIYALNNGSRCGAFKILRNEVPTQI